MMFVGLLISVECNLRNWDCAGRRPSHFYTVYSYRACRCVEGVLTSYSRDLTSLPETTL